MNYEDVDQTIAYLKGHATETTKTLQRIHDTINSGASALEAILDQIAENNAKLTNLKSRVEQLERIVRPKNVKTD